MISITFPCHTVSEANAHTHWRARQRRAAHQRGLAKLVLRSQVKPPAPPLKVTLERIAPRALDSDNLAGSQKHVRDGVADWLGIDDRDPRVTWAYLQSKGQPREYAVRVLIEVGE